MNEDYGDYSVALPDDNEKVATDYGDYSAALPSDKSVGDFGEYGAALKKESSTPETTKALAATAIAAHQKAADARLQSFGVDTARPEDSYVASEHPIAENYAQGAIDVAKGIPSMVTQLPGMAYQGLKFAVGGPQEKVQVAADMAKQAVPMGVQMAKDLQSPIGSREFARGVIQSGMMAAPGLELVRDLRAPLEISKPPIQGEPVLKSGEAPVESALPKTEGGGDLTEKVEKGGMETQGPGQEEARILTEPAAVSGAETPPAAVPLGGVHAEAMAERPIEAPEPGDAVGWEEATKRGNAWLDAGGDPQKIIRSFRGTGKIGVPDMGRMRAAMLRIEAVTNQAGDALRESPSDPKLQEAYQGAVSQEQAFANAYKPMHTVASNTLRSLQGRVPLTEDMAQSQTALERQFRDINGDQPFTPEHATRANRISRDMTKANGEYAKANGELYKRLDSEYGRIRSPRKGPPTLSDLARTFGEGLKEVCDT